MKNVARIAALSFLMFAGLASTRASAVMYLCEDICTRLQTCARSCVGSQGVNTTCGQWGCCVSNQTNCEG